MSFGSPLLVVNALSTQLDGITPFISPVLSESHHAQATHREAVGDQPPAAKPTQGPFAGVVPIDATRFLDSGVTLVACPTGARTRSLAPRKGVLRFPSHDKRKTHAPVTSQRWVMGETSWEVVGGESNRGHTRGGTRWWYHLQATDWWDRRRIEKVCGSLPTQAPLPSSSPSVGINTLSCQYTRGGAVFPATGVPVLMLRTDCSLFALKSAPSSRLLPGSTGTDVIRRNIGKNLTKSTNLYSLWANHAIITVTCVRN